MQKTSHHRLGQLMCQATLDILWPSARAGRPKADLKCRVGSGQATYHRFDSRTKQHVITYGVRMIMAKQAPETALGWLSTREINRLEYFGGEVSPLNLLAHTCCHEFAHLLQHAAGHRYYGSVHNRPFYTLLDRLYSEGQAEKVRHYLKNRAREEGLALSETPFDLPSAEDNARQWQVGDTVSFGEGARQRRGRIVRVNRKTCTVDSIEPLKGQRYRVPVQMLRGLKDSV